MMLMMKIVAGVVLGNMAFLALLVARLEYEMKHEKPEVSDEEWYGHS